jgi:DNA (cytosine-5)-methyltransferase 1
MIYGSVCSGVEAATVAWHPLGWKPRWFSEIEKFPSAVLAHHYPDVPNHGDMTTFKEWPNDPIDLLVGGTPCQSFSIAGLRKGLDDPRGNLMLTYLAIAARYKPRWVAWENVPGVLSSNGGRDFGTFLGALGELGYGFAYRVLDAQYFGVAQRRRRVFVVGYLGDWRRAAAVLFERESLSGHPAPSREPGQETAGDVGPGATGASHWDAVTNPHPTLNQSHNTGGIGASNQEVFSQRGSGLVPTPYHEVAHCLNAGGMGRIDYETESFVVNAAIPILEPGARTGKSTTDVRAGMGVGDAGDPMYTLQAGKQHGVAFAQNTRDEVRLVGGDGSLVGALAAQLGMKQTSYVAVSTGGDIAHTLNTANNGKGCSEDGTGRGVPTIAFSSKDYGADATEDMAPTLRAGGHAESHANAGVPPAVTVALRGREGGATAEIGGEVATALRASQGGGDKPHVLTPITVRRLTPRECERLQGFPDDYTLIPYRSRMAADGPRYKAMGNSMAVPVMRWIGQRIDEVDKW